MQEVVGVIMFFYYCIKLIYIIRKSVRPPVSTVRNMAGTRQHWPSDQAPDRVLSGTGVWVSPGSPARFRTGSWQVPGRFLSGLSGGSRRVPGAPGAPGSWHAHNFLMICAVRVKWLAYVYICELYYYEMFAI